MKNLILALLVGTLAGLLLSPAPSAAVGTNGTASVSAIYTFDNLMAKMSGTINDGRVTVTNGTTGESLRQTAVVIDSGGNLTAAGVSGSSVISQGDLDVVGVINQYRLTTFRVTSATTLGEDQAGAVVLADSSAGGFTITLPTQPANGTPFTITQVDGGANTVVVACGTGDVIDGGGVNFTFPARAAGPATFSWSLCYDAVADNWAVTAARE